MARFYTNENFPLQVVRRLRALSHDVLTSLEAGQANRRIPDEEVLAFATSQGRVLLTQNRFAQRMRTLRGRPIVSMKPYPLIPWI